MDVLGTITNVIAITKDIAKVCQICADLYGDSKDIPQFKPIRNWCSGITKNLELINREEYQEDLKQFDAQINDCYTHLKRIKVILDGVEPKSRSFVPVLWAAFKKSWKEDEINKLQADVESEMRTVFDWIHTAKTTDIWNAVNPVNQAHNERNKTKKDDSIYMIPFSKNDAFVGRQDTLQDINEKLFNKNGRSVALYGLGGCGKTQIALEFAYQVQQKRNSYSIFWIFANTLENFQRSYQDIAEYLDPVLYKQNKDLDVKIFVKNYLSKTYKNDYILILDNVDDLMFAPEDSRRATRSRNIKITDYLPRNTGKILCTTRSRQVAFQISKNSLIEVDSMDYETALALFTSFFEQEPELDIDYDINELKSLFTILTYLPLAITQAASYINENQCTVSEYLELLQDTNESDVANVLSEDFHEDARYSEILNPVALTFITSFDKIRQQNPFTIECLCTIACFDRSEVHESLFPKSKSSNEIKKAIGILVSYSFISRARQFSPPKSRSSLTSGSNLQVSFTNKVSESYICHRLVYLSIRNWLRSQDKLETFMAKALHILVEEIDKNKSSHEEAIDIHKKHIISILTQDSTLVDTLEDRVYLLLNCTDVPFILNIIEESTEWKGGSNTILTFQPYLKFIPFLLTYSISVLGSEYSLSICNQLYSQAQSQLGDDSPVTLNYLHLLIPQYILHDQHNEALKLQETLVTKSINVLGKDHLYTLYRMQDLSWLYKYFNRSSRLQDVHSQLTEQIKGLLGKNTIESLSNVIILFSMLRWQLSDQGSHELQAMIVYEAKKYVDTDLNELPDSKLASTVFKQLLATQEFHISEDVETLIYYGAHLCFNYRKTSRSHEAREIGNILSSFGAKLNSFDTISKFMERMLAIFDFRKMETFYLSIMKSIQSEYIMQYVVNKYKTDFRLDDATTVEYSLMELQKTLHGTFDLKTINTMISLARYYRMVDRFDDTIKVLESVELGRHMQDDQVKEYALKFTISYLAKQDFEGCLHPLQQCLKIWQGSKTSHIYGPAFMCLYLTLERHVWEGNLSLAIELCKTTIESLTIEEKVPTFELILSNIYMYQSKIDQAIQINEEMISSLSSNTTYSYDTTHVPHSHKLFVMLQLGYRYMQCSRFNDAANIFNEIISDPINNRNKFSRYAIVGKSDVLWAQGCKQEALEMYESIFPEILNDNEIPSGLIYGLAKRYITENRVSDAVKLYEDINEQELFGRLDGELWPSLYRLYIDNGRVDEVLENIELQLGSPIDDSEEGTTPPFRLTPQTHIQHRKIDEGELVRAYAYAKKGVFSEAFSLLDKEQSWNETSEVYSIDPSGKAIQDEVRYRLIEMRATILSIQGKKDEANDLMKIVGPYKRYQETKYPWEFIV